MNLKQTFCRAILTLAIAIMIVDTAHAQADRQEKSAQAASQATTSSAATQLQAVVVTGTLIHGVAAPVGSTVVSVTPNEIKEAGAISVISYMQNLPMVSGLGFNTASPNGANNFQDSAGNASFSQSINLRGLGSLDTLTLINGARMASVLVGGATDIGEIPTNMIERVDVVADGSSATYGADAIAGTVNLIFRKPEDVNETTGQYGFSRGTYQWQVGQVIGKTWSAESSGLGRGGIIIAYQHTDSQPVYARDLREYTSDTSPQIGAAGLPSTAASPGNVTGLQGPAGTSALYAVPSGLSYTDGATLGRLGPANQPNYTDAWYDAMAIAGMQQNNVAFNFTQDLAPWLKFYANGFYAVRDATGGNSDGGATTETLAVPNTNPYSPCATAAAAALAGLPAPSLANSQGITCPANGTIESQYNFENEQNGAAVVRTGQIEAHEWIAGFDIRMPFSWVADAFFDDSTERDSEVITDQVNRNALNQVLGQQIDGVYTKPSSVPFFNPFCTDTEGACNPQATLAYIGIPGGAFKYLNRNKVEESNLTLNGPLFEIFGQKAKLAAGIDYLSEFLSVANPSNTGTASTSIFANTAPTVVSRNTRAAFYELYLPVVGSGDALPFAQKVDVDVGGRYTKYSTGFSSFNQKFGLDWTVADGLKLHGTWGTSFQAPTLRSSSATAGFGWYGGEVNCAELVGCSGAADLDSLIDSGGNPVVEPETARTWTFGVDWKPTNIPGLRASIDYFNIALRNYIVRPMSVSNSVADANNPALTPFVTFNPTYFPGKAVVTSYVQQLLPGQHLSLGSPLTQAQFDAALAALTSNPLHPAVTPNAFPYAYFANDLYANTGGINMSGIDFQVSFVFDTAWGGEALFGATGTYNLHFEQSLLTGTPFTDYDNDLGYPLRFRTRVQAGLRYGPWTGNLFDNYENPYSVLSSNLPRGAPAKYQRVGQWNTVDASLAYMFGDQQKFKPLSDTRLIVSVTNVFDRAPPFVLTAGGPQYDPNTASALGRGVQLQLTKDW